MNNDINSQNKTQTFGAGDKHRKPLSEGVDNQKQTQGQYTQTGKSGDQR